MNARAPRPLSTLAWLLLAAWVAFPGRVRAAGGARAVQVASSAQLVLDAEAHPGELVLWITRTRNHTPVTGAGNVMVTLNGHAVKVSAKKSDYVISTDGMHGGKQSIAVIVAHNGIRELLTGAVTLPNTPSMLATLQKHSTWAWWVLNIGVLLLAFRMISRRKKDPVKPPKDPG